MVSLEFLKIRQKQERVVDVFVVSADGQDINVFQPNHDQGVPVGNQPLSLTVPHTNSFTYNTLPEKYWKKYQYAAR